MNPSTSQSPELEVHSLTVGYDRRPVIKGFSFTVSKGEWVAILGPNGSGKSTLLKTLAYIIKPWEGEILLRGKPLSKFTRRRISQCIAWVPERSELSFPFSVEETVLMGRYPYNSRNPTREDWSIARWAMELMEVYELRDRNVLELSAGEYRRVMLARALAQQPLILLLDEPSAHLDVKHQAHIFKLLSELHKQGQTIIIASHNLNLVSLFVPKVILIKDGTKRKEGITRQVLTESILTEIYDTELSLLKHPEYDIPIFLPER